MGIGNLLLGDEGVGVHAARELLKEELPEGIKVLEIGTSILDALPELEKAHRVIVLDAMSRELRNGKPTPRATLELWAATVSELIDATLEDAGRG